MSQGRSHERGLPERILANRFINLKNKGGETVSKEMLVGWKQIADHLDKPVRWVMRRKPELERCGALGSTFVGRPRRKMVCALKSHLDDWVKNKNLKGEFL